jgi:hypothetical protein
MWCVRVLSFFEIGRDFKDTSRAICGIACRRSGILLICRQTPYSLQRYGIYPLRHAIKVYQQTQKDFVCRWTVLMYTAQITQNRNTGDVLPMKCKHTRRQPCYVGSISGRIRSVQILMLAIVGCGDLCQKPCYHLNDICNRHPTNLIFQSRIICRPPSPGLPSVRQKLLCGETLDMCQIPHLDCINPVLLNIIHRSSSPCNTSMRGRRLSIRDSWFHICWYILFWRLPIRR